MAALTLRDIIAQSYVPTNSPIRMAGNPAPGFLPNLQGIPALGPAGSTGFYNNDRLAQILASQEAGAGRAAAAAVGQGPTGIGRAAATGGPRALPSGVMNALEGGPQMRALGPGPARSALSPGSLGALTSGAYGPEMPPLGPQMPPLGPQMPPLGPQMPKAASAAAMSADDLARLGGIPMVDDAAMSVKTLAEQVGRKGKLGDLYKSMTGPGTGKISNFFAKGVPLSLTRGLMGGVVGIPATMGLGALGDLVVGGEAEDEGFSLGGFLKSLGAGAGGGAVAGAVGGGGAGALPGALIGGLLGAGGYLLEEKAANDNFVDPLEQRATMRNFVAEYDIDPHLADQVIGEYSLMAQVFRENGQTDKLKPLTETAMTSLAGLIGQKSQQTLLDEQKMTPAEIASMTSVMNASLAPYYNQIPENSPYKVAGLQVMGSIPQSLYLQSLMGGTGMAAQSASGVPAAGLAGMSPEDMKKLEEVGISI